MATVMSRRSKAASAKVRTLADVLKRLGVTADRVRADLKPGRATVADLIKLHDSEDRLYELVDGYLVEKVMGAKESFVGGQLIRYINNFLDDHDLGFAIGADGTLLILPHLVRLPDLSFISWAQRPEHTVPDEPVPELHPDLAVEVLSAKNTKAELRRKIREYFESGARLVWLIDPKTRTARVYTAPDAEVVLTEADSLDGGDVLPGFRLPLRKLFARLEQPGRPPRRRKG